MRYELVISTPIHDDRKSAFVSSPQRFVGQEFVGKIADGDNDDCSKDGGLEKCDRLKEDETVGDVEKADNDNDDESIKASLVIGRGGFRLLDDAKDGFEGNETSFKEKERTFSLLQRDQTLQLSGVENLQIKAMLPERYGKPISTGHVLVAQIFDRTKSAIFLQAICQAFRLPENYYHLKRVKSEMKSKDGGKPGVILHLIIRDVPQTEILDENDDVQLSAIAQRYFSESLSALQANSAAPDDLSLHLDAIGDPYVTRVSASAPLTRIQYDAARALWPCTFHEDKRITSLIDGRHFSSAESDVIRRNLALTLRVAEGAKKMFATEGDCDACVIVDPRENEIIAVAHDLSQFEDDDRFNDRISDKSAVTLSPCSSSSSSSSTDIDFKPVFKIRPYYHAPMVAIDLAAVSQGGGAYSIPLNELTLMSCASPSNSIPASTSTTSFTEENGPRDDDNSNASSNSSSNVTYLCTGYDVYLSKEPCLMCAMSLIHSRIRRLFYRHKTSDGALGSKFSIHTLESLNHHFEAFCLE